MVKTLFYTGARVSEFVNIEIKDLHFNLNPPQIYLAEAKGGSDGYGLIRKVGRSQYFFHNLQYRENYH